MSFRGVFTVLAIGVLCAASLLADEMPYQLGTSGAFSGLPPGAELGFTGTAAPIAGVTGAGESGLLSLGEFTLQRPTANPAIPLSGGFNLAVTFNVPGGIGGGQTGVFYANLSGVLNKNNGWISVDLGPPRAFNFSNSRGSGSFNLAIQRVYRFPAGATGSTAVQPLIGSISGATFTPATETPEPATLLFMLSGAAGIIVLRRKFLAG